LLWRHMPCCRTRRGGSATTRGQMKMGRPSLAEWAVVVVVVVQVAESTSLTCLVWAVGSEDSLVEARLAAAVEEEDSPGAGEAEVVITTIRTAFRSICRFYLLLGLF
jgi:hypothetical protein